MTIRFACPKCGKQYRVPESSGGRTAACAGCGAKLTVPQPLRQPTAETPDTGETGEAEAPEPSAYAPLQYSEKKLMSQDLVDMTAMVDIVFFLLIFFLVTSMGGVASTISMPPPNPQKPGAQARRAVADYEADYLIVRIDRENAIWFEGEQINSEQELRHRIKNARQSANAPNKMLVLGSGEAYHGTVVMVLDAGYGAGLEDVRLAVKDET
jgi:biopolymer transport protein ExbD